MKTPASTETYLPVKSLVPSVNALVEAYGRSEQDMTFGAWVLSNVFPHATSATLHGCREFADAQRTSDARCYLLDMLQRGSLSVESVSQFLTEQETLA